jgi:hypothetical protein
MVQVIEFLPSKYKALSSNPNTMKRKMDDLNEWGCHCPQYPFSPPSLTESPVCDGAHASQNTAVIALAVLCDHATKSQLIRCRQSRLRNALAVGKEMHFPLPTGCNVPVIKLDSGDCNSRGPVMPFLWTA